MQRLQLLKRLRFFNFHNCLGSHGYSTGVSSISVVGGSSSDVVASTTGSFVGSSTICFAAARPLSKKKKHTWKLKERKYGGPPWKHKRGQ
ncbi:hypothetical protein CTI12_AA189450 [Artemisia annua]|uniref:Uncharacterized protein n=1 Tax=Artemisia annua TaxID=35608 RepID=A0A2U1P6V3_ARTAN|nr:hypothetical protein CTI12_AA189450 [Artemisia annua]